MLSAELFPHHHDLSLATALLTRVPQHHWTSLSQCFDGFSRLDIVKSVAWSIGNWELPRFHRLRYHNHLPGLGIISYLLEPGVNKFIFVERGLLVFATHSLISNDLRHRIYCTGRVTEIRKLENSKGILRLFNTRTSLLIRPLDLTHPVFLSSPPQVYLSL